MNSATTLCHLHKPFLIVLFQNLRSFFDNFDYKIVIKFTYISNPVTCAHLITKRAFSKLFHSFYMVFKKPFYFLNTLRIPIMHIYTLYVCICTYMNNIYSIYTLTYILKFSLINHYWWFMMNCF